MAPAGRLHDHLTWPDGVRSAFRARRLSGDRCHRLILRGEVRSCRRGRRLNPGGEPERDDTGLPPVDIEIPDDARELDRDVQAYYREQRALRRQQRRSRFRGFLAKDGIVLPLLALSLIPWLI